MSTSGWSVTWPIRTPTLKTGIWSEISHVFLLSDSLHSKIEVPIASPKHGGVVLYGSQKNTGRRR